MDKSYFRYLRAVRHVSESSIQSYAKKWEYIYEYLNQNSLSLCQDSLERFIDEKKLSGSKNNTLNTYINAINNYIFYLDHKDVVHSFKKFKSFKKKRPDIVLLSHLEIESILNQWMDYGRFRGKDCSSLNQVYNAFSRLLAVTGSRFTAAASITIKDCDFINGTIRLRKTKSGQWLDVYITEPLLSQLKELASGKQADELLFQNMAGNQLHQQDYSFDLRKRAVQAGINKRVHPHLFRHSFATDLLKNGAKLEEVADLLGHEDIQTTKETYVHLADETLRRASERHSMVRPFVDPKYILDQIKQFIDSFKYYEDKISIQTQEDEEKLVITIHKKKQTTQKP